VKDRLAVVPPFKFGQNKKSKQMRFGAVLIKPSGTTPRSSATRPKISGLKALVREESTVAKK